jgi:serine/threonine protein kinase
MQVLSWMHYTKLRQIGVGEGFHSTVYLADEPQLGGRVAVKEIDRAELGDPSTYFAEAKVMFQVAHRNVVEIRYASENHSHVCLAMPYYKRGSLARRICDRPLRLSEVLRIADGCLAGLAHIHVKGYLHLDVRPSNLLFSDADVPMVSDFGQSRLMASTGTISAPGMYRSAIPPEVEQLGAAAIQSDIYQAGLLLYRALNGDPFFVSQVPNDDGIFREKLLRGKLPDRRHFMPHVPERLRRIVRKALRVNPVDRFRSARDMADALCRTHLALDWCPEPLPEGGMSWRASRPAHADLVVERISESGAWDVRTFTEAPGHQRRVKNRHEYWRRGLSLDEASAHLTAVFARLPE